MLARAQLRFKALYCSRGGKAICKMKRSKTVSKIQKQNEVNSLHKSLMNRSVKGSPICLEPKLKE